MEEKKFCPYCGERLKGQERFCGKCGKRITPISEISPQHSKKIRHTGMIKIFVVLIILVICGWLAFLIYTHTGQKQILGSWLMLDEDGEYAGYGMTFYEDGRILDTASGLTGDYVIDDGKIMVSYDDGWEVERYVFEYELERDTLTLNLEGSDDEFTLVKENNSL
ncbi:MAG TPA: hypothetical protein H9758_06450 [Candidatus Mediterraneibacter faecipullorum]|uniref:Zinc-ribbon domain-containing protein n=1 Tax=Candidatus Mediterraneibacter faecipullorum TaxID=2838670 RepID=A0A9D2NM22_9FIRM|nr:hypothetical protein [Candidatus Mediterraneibacter faecipullorum]